MAFEMDLPADVVAEIEANRKVNAIKLLREHQSMGLAEAKAVVDAYIESNPTENTAASPEAEGDIGRIILLIIGVGTIFGLYTYFT